MYHIMYNRLKRFTMLVIYQHDNPHCSFSPLTTLNITFKELNITKSRWRSVTNYLISS